VSLPAHNSGSVSVRKRCVCFSAPTRVGKTLTSSRVQTKTGLPFWTPLFLTPFYAPLLAPFLAPFWAPSGLPLDPLLDPSIFSVKIKKELIN